MSTATVYCKNCGEAFAPNRSWQVFCNVLCSDSYAHKAARSRAKRGKAVATQRQVEVQSREAADERRWKAALDDIRHETEDDVIASITGLNRPKVERKEKEPDIYDPNEGLEDI